jgi:Na+/H+ antiporter NhaD/arsenite permease-like protein
MHGPHLDGATLSLLWSLPFAGMLLSIALFPLMASHTWEHHFGKISTAWAVAFLAPCVAIFGFKTTLAETLHTIVLEYIPFIILLFSLFVVAGGIRLVGNLVGTPATNTGVLAVGTAMASFLGTTGASMLLIRPMIAANADRRHKVHVFVFFIFLVSNIGGSLTPLGDPPLFLGFLKGVDFLWTMEHMAIPMVLTSAILLALFYAIDRFYWRREDREVTTESRVPRRLRIEGGHNFIYLAGIVGAVLLSGLWHSGIIFHLGYGIDLDLQGLVRDAVLLGLAGLSLLTTKRATRIENAFTWIPIQEVGILFVAIFITMIPTLAVLRAGSSGALAPLLTFVSTADGQPVNVAYFWLTGILSSFLDNAPTYLVFFNLAGGDSAQLMGPLETTLLAISVGAVFMGANTYIGNAPNFMVKSICEERGIRMPSFFGYMLWSGAILIPLFFVLGFVFFV